MKYQTTKAECQKKINANGNVCDRCGRDIKPLKTVNNAGEPTSQKSIIYQFFKNWRQVKIKLWN